MMVNHVPIEDTISQLRQKLALLKDENKSLRQRLRDKEDAYKGHVKQLKSIDQDFHFVQKQLHSYAGADVKKKEDAIEISFTCICSGITQKQYKMILLNLQEKSWKVGGYNFPLSVYREPGTRLLSEQILAKFVQGVAREIQAYTERCYQVSETEKILKEKAGASIWYCTKFQKVFLTLPINIPDLGEQAVGQVTLNYEVDHILPSEVDTKAPGLNARHHEKLSARLREFFMRFSLLAVIKEEFEPNSFEEGSTVFSIAHSSSL